MAQLAYVATVQILVEANTVSEAGECINGFLTEMGIGEGEIIDWSYVKVGDQLLTPTRRALDLVNYQEGDFSA